jgi:hypothetical protein
MSYKLLASEFAIPLALLVLVRELRLVQLGQERATPISELAQERDPK